MGILNVTPDSFSGDGLLGGAATRSRPRSTQARRMVDEGADLLDVGGESTPAGPRRRRRRRRDRPGRARSSRAIRAAAARTCRSASTRRRRPSPRRRSTPGPTSSTTSGASATDDALPAARRRARRPDRPDAQPGRAALHERSWRRSSPTSQARDRAGPRGRRRVGRDPRRPRVRVRQDRRPQPRAAARPRGAPRPRPADPARHVAQVDPRQGARPAARTSGSRRRSRRRRSASPPASTSSASTTSARTSGPPGWRTRSSAAPWPRRAGREDGADDRPDRAPRHARSRAATASATRSSATPQPFEVDVELVARPAAGGPHRRPRPGPSTTAGLRRVVREIVRIDSFNLLEALAEAIAASSSPTFPVDEVVVRVRKPDVRLGGPLDYAGVEIRRRAASRPTGLTGPQPRRAGARPARPRRTGRPVPSVTLSVIVLPSRRIVERHRVARRELRRGPRRAGARCRSSSPLIVVTMSPSLTPAFVGRAVGHDRRDRSPL